MRRYKAALLGYYGFGNLGDELLVRACLEILSSIGVKRQEISVLSNNPEETSKNFSVDSVNRWKFFEIFRVLRETERLIFGGGGIFQDRTSLMSCVWYWAVVRLARLMGVKVFAAGQSIGPLSSRISRLLAGNALRSCGLVQVRDEKSKILAESLGCKNVVRGVDLVMTLSSENRISTGNRMLVNLRPCPELERYAEILRPRIRADDVGVAMSPEDEAALSGLGLREIVRVRTFEEAEELWRSSRCAVGMRLHFGVLSRIFRTPLAMMPYDVKVNEFAGQSKVPCISDEWIEPVMPLELPENLSEAKNFFREIMTI